SSRSDTRTSGKSEVSNGGRAGPLPLGENRQRRTLGAKLERLAADHGFGVLRYRDDERDRARVRHRPFGFGSLSRVAAAGRSHDRLGPRRAEDGPGREAPLRSNGRSEV